MNYLVSLFVTAALVSLQCDLVANAVIDTALLELDNSLEASDAFQASPEKRRRVRKFGMNLVHVPPKTARLLPGSTLELTCGALSSPAPMVMWLKNGEPINDYIQTYEIIPPAKTNPFTVTEMTHKVLIETASPGDEYTCVATSGIRKKTATTTIITDGEQDEENLIAKLLLAPSTPVITVFYEYTFALHGSSVLVPCRAVSYSKMQVFWQDSTGSPIHQDGRRRTLPSGDLVIDDINFNDYGNFSCTAQNMYGKDKVTSFIYVLQT